MLKNILLIKGAIISVIGQVEFNLDISEEDLQPNLTSDAIKNIDSSVKALKSAIDGFDAVNVLTAGATVVLAGPTNAGKSTLFNTLLKQDRAIVSEVAGTTRDVLENTINIEGVPCVLKDTAGIRKTKDVIEKIGVEKSNQEILTADLVLYLGPSDTDLSSENNNIIYVRNKKDLGGSGKNYDISISALTGENISSLKALILKRVSSDFSDLGFIITSQRQLSSLISTKKHLIKSKNCLLKSSGLELVVEDLNSALSCLDEITNKTTKDDVLNAVFSSFCVGK